MMRSLENPLWSATGLLFMILIITLLCMVLSAFPASSARSLPVASVETGQPRELAPSPLRENLGQIQAASTYTSLLPIVVQGSQPPVVTPFGVETWNVNDTILTRMRTMQNRWVRLRLYWSQIEPENTIPSNYNWPPKVDQKLAQLAANDIEVIVTVLGNPSWAATYTSGPIDLVDVSQFAEFMGAVVARYSERPYNVKYWEFYNEPDNGDPFYATAGWGYFGNEPQAYVDILSAVYGPIKAMDPQAQIVLGGIAYDDWTETGGPFVKSFLDDVLGLGAGAYFDVMNFHYYPAFHETWDSYGKGIIGKTAFLRDKLAGYGLDKPFICTEASMWSDAAHGGSDELQSRYVPQVFARTMAADLGTTIWFALEDEDYLGAYKYGLIESDHTPKPAFYAYQTATQQLSRTEFVQALGPDQTGFSQIEAYEFLSLDGTSRIVVAWTGDDSTVEMALQAGEVVRVNKFGDETVVSDGDDGVVDGVVHVDVGPSPIYLRLATTG